jgi:hypothetical protein
MRMFRAMIALALAATTSVARAAPPTEEAAIAAATRFETGPLLCRAMDRAARERHDCTRASLPPHARWQTSVHGEHRVVTAMFGGESFWIITLAVDARGRVIAENSVFSRGGV